MRVVRGAGAAAARAAFVATSVCLALAACQPEPPTATAARTTASPAPIATTDAAAVRSGTASADPPATPAADPPSAASAGYPADAPPASDLDPELAAWLQEFVTAYPEPPVASDTYWAQEAQTRAAASDYYALLLAQNDADGAYHGAACAPQSWIPEVAQGRMSYDRYTMLSMAMLWDRSRLPEGGAELCLFEDDLASGEAMGMMSILFFDATSPQVKAFVARSMNPMAPLEDMVFNDADYYRQGAVRLRLGQAP